MEADVNYVAVLVAAIASMVVGGLWYGALFKKQWMSLMGYTPDSMKGMKMTANKAYALQFVASLVMACVLSRLISSTGGVGVSAGVTLGFWIWLGFIAPVTLGAVLWENRPWKLWFINTSHYLVMLVVMGAILAVWK